MQIRKGLIPLFVFMGIILLLSDGSSQEESAEKERNDMIRKDLLFKGGEQLGLPLRNIFSPISSRSAQIGTALVEDKRSVIPKVEQRDQVNEKKEPARPALNVRYIGYVRSEGKIVALIFFRGIAFAVEKGEFLEEQIKVEEVTVEEIVLTLGGFQPLKFAIEGEAP